MPPAAAAPRRGSPAPSPPPSRRKGCAPARLSRKRAPLLGAAAAHAQDPPIHSLFPPCLARGLGGAGATAVESPVAALAFLPPPAVCSPGCAALVSGTSAPNAQTVVASGRVDVGSKFYGILSDG